MAKVKLRVKGEGSSIPQSIKSVGNWAKLPVIKFSNFQALTSAKISCEGVHKTKRRKDRDRPSSSRCISEGPKKYCEEKY